MENDIWILDVNIIYHVGCFAVLASSPCSAEAVISRANEWWVQHGFIQIYLSSVLLSAEPGAGHCWFSGQGGWTSAGGHDPWVSLWELSHPVLASANPHPERSGSKAKWDGRSCQAGVQCHGCDEQRAKWLLLIHAKGFPPRLFGRIKELEGMSINPTRVCLHWTPREFIVLNVLSNFCTAQELKGLKMVDHIMWHFLHIFLTSHNGKLNWG